MKRFKAFRFELMPSAVQVSRMKQHAGACRFVYNRALALQRELRESNQKRLNYPAMCRLLTQWRHDPETIWLAASPVHSLQQSLRDLDRAIVNFLSGRAREPRMRRKAGSNRFRYPSAREFKVRQGESRMFLPGVGWMRYRNSRDIVGRIKSSTVSRCGLRWFASVLTEQEVEEVPVHPSDTAVGIDMGVVNLATLSNGKLYPGLRNARNAERRLGFLGRTLRRKKRFGANWRKVNAHMARLTARIANIRRDYLHKTSTEISKSHAIVVVEELRPSEMLKKEGVKRKANSWASRSLNLSILDQGWYEFRRQLGYKQEWRGGLVLSVPPMNTSRRCSGCGHISKANRKGQARFECVECGYTLNADINAACNILAAGYAALAHGESAQFGCSVKWEPAEAPALLAQQESPAL